MLFEYHKSKFNPEPFGIVIENDTNKDVIVDFLGHELFRKYDDGIKVYPMYKDLFFNSITDIQNWLMSVGAILIEVTKFQSSLIYDVKNRYFLDYKEVDANGTVAMRRFNIVLEDDLPSHTAKLREEIIISYNTSFTYKVNKYSHVVIKFIPRKKPTYTLISGRPPIIKNENEEDSFYSKIKQSFGEYSEEKKKKLLLII